MEEEPIRESLDKLRESKDFVALAALGHELSDGCADGGIDRAAPMEASFRCRFCGDLVRFRDLAWGLVSEPSWVLAEISGGDWRSGCHARRMRRIEHRRLYHVKQLERWKRLGWKPAGRARFN